MYVLSQFRQQLTYDVVLRVYEGRGNLWFACHYFLAYQVQQTVVLVATLCYLHHSSCLYGSAHATEDAVRDGAYGCGRSHYHIVNHTHIEVAIGTYQFRIRTG